MQRKFVSTFVIEYNSVLYGPKIDITVYLKGLSDNTLVPLIRGIKGVIESELRYERTTS
jgi:hypothetical protein